VAKSAIPKSAANTKSPWRGGRKRKREHDGAAGEVDEREQASPVDAIGDGAGDQDSRHVERSERRERSRRSRVADVVVERVRDQMSVGETRARVAADEERDQQQPEPPLAKGGDHASTLARAACGARRGREERGHDRRNRQHSNEDELDAVWRAGIDAVRAGAAAPSRAVVRSWRGPD
jgi:hypothetical protein